MKKVIFQIGESLRFALGALRSNLLRTILSLLSVTVGIFAIILVLTFVDSLEKNIKDSFNFIGTGVIYVEKWPWLADNSGEYRWWDFWRRPTPSYAEYKSLKENLKHVSVMTISAEQENMTLKFKNNSVRQIRLVGAGEEYELVNSFEISQGRYFTPEEVTSGRSVVVIGDEVATKLFPKESAVGQSIKIKDLRYFVIGVIKREGQSFLGTPSNDLSALIPYNSFRKLYQTGTGRWYETQSSITLKGHDSDFGLVELENEARGLMRGRRGLRPGEKDNFAVNRPEALLNIIGTLFDGVSIAGWIIGGASILVGGFGIANIMFVSVKERTSIIGLQKSLGAKNYFILTQFLFEAIFLCLIGGSVGLLLVFLITLIPMGETFKVTLTFQNILIGLVVSTTIGVISGIVPAAMAARLDPVEAIRS